MTVLFDAAGRRRSPATMPGYHAGRSPRNKGMRYPADPPTVEEIVAVMRHAADDRHGRRLRAMIVVLWRAGLRIQEALALADTRGQVIVDLRQRIVALERRLRRTRDECEQRVREPQALTVDLENPGLLRLPILPIEGPNLEEVDVGERGARALHLRRIGRDVGERVVDRR